MPYTFGVVNALLLKAKLKNHDVSPKFPVWEMLISVFAKEKVKIVELLLEHYLDRGWRGAQYPSAGR